MDVQQKTPAEYFLLDCEKYEDYLETFVTKMDLRFTRDLRFCRKFVELGYRSHAVYTLNQFENQKNIQQERLRPNKGKIERYGNNLNSKDPLLIELAARELPNHHKSLSTIIFLTYRNKHGFVVSGFIDFEASLTNCNLKLPRCTNWEKVFKETSKVRPKSDDLSFYGINPGIVCHNNSNNYIVLQDVEYGLTFMHRGDHKKVFVNISKSSTEQNYLRSVVVSPKYGYVVLFDHIVRKKI